MLVLGLVAVIVPAARGEAQGYCRDCSWASQDAPRAGNLSEYVAEMVSTMNYAKFATLSTLAANNDAKGDINSRIVWPKPANASEDNDEIRYVYFATTNYSRKFEELSPAGRGPKPRVNMLYWDLSGQGYVSIRGKALICDEALAREEYYDEWKFVYPEGPDTPWYRLIRIVPDHIEYLSYQRYDVDVGGARPDWMPLTIERDGPDDPWRRIV